MVLQAITEAGECRGNGVHIEKWTRTWREELMTGDFSMMSSGTLWPALPLPLHLWIRYSSFLFLSLCSSILCCSSWICRRTSNTRSTSKPSWNSFFVCLYVTLCETFQGSDLGFVLRHTSITMAMVIFL